ncbi:MAG: beta-lactamase family protein [Proteobacteria bacterium]|nr:beta-lactamase family protein [Pseudomonadota bacterium]
MTPASPDLDSPATPEEAGFDRKALGRLAGAFAAQVDAGRLPGAVWMVARHGRLAAYDSVGRLDPRRDAPMPRDAIFRIYSMTKPIVSLAVLMLLEQGRLALADPLGRHLPAFAATQVGHEHDGALELAPPAKPITIQDLLRHTSGLTYEFLAPSRVRSAYNRARIFGRELDGPAFCTTLAGLPLMHEPGTVWDYSRATDVLGHLIEAITGERLGAYLERTIFGPLGMRDTTFQVPERERGRIAEPHATDPDTGQAVSLLDPCAVPARDSGGGGLAGTVRDYVRFLTLMQQGGSLDGVRLAGRKTIEFMTADHLGSLPVAGDLLPPGHGFGLGVAVRLQTGVGTMPGSAGTYGWGGIAGTVFFVDPVERMFAILMTQAPGQRIEYGALFRNLVYAALA